VTVVLLALCRRPGRLFQAGNRSGKAEAALFQCSCAQFGVGSFVIGFLCNATVSVDLSLCQVVQCRIDFVTVWMQ